MISDTLYDAWLRDPANRPYQTTLIVLFHHAGSVKLSTQGYISENHIPFHNWIVKDSLPKMEYRLGSPVGFGGFRAVNPLNNDWQTFQWTGHACNIYFGDIRWPFTDFRQTGSTLIDDITHEGNNLYNVSLTDLGKNLQIPVQSETADGAQKLIVCGDVYNVKPQVVDAFNLIYRYNDWADGTNTDSFSLDDQGQDITSHVDIDTPSPGLFKFKAGHNPTSSSNLRFHCVSQYKTAFDIIQKIANVHALGTVKKSGFSNFEDNAILGLTIRSNTDINKIIDDIMLNLGGYSQLDALGHINLIIPTASANPVKVTTDDIGQGFKQIGTIKAVQKVIVNYRKNQDPNSDSELSILIDTPELKEPFQYEYKTIEEVTSAVATTEIRTYDTYYANQSDAQTFADNRALWLSVDHDRYGFPLRDICNRFMLGDQLTIEHPNLAANHAMLTKISRDASIKPNPVEVLTL